MPRPTKPFAGTATISAVQRQKITAVHPVMRETAQAIARERLLTMAPINLRAMTSLMPRSRNWQQSSKALDIGKLQRPLAAFLFVCFGSVSSWAMSDTHALHAMDGAWAGDGTPFVIDVQRLQANLDPEKAFDWQIFRVINITGSLITFNIGQRRFIALMSSDDEIHLTEFGVSGERSLRKTKPLPISHKR